ncbi:MAG: 3-oxoacyl-ACP synthase III family protein, partial [Acidobacteriota bacterium]
MKILNISYALPSRQVTNQGLIEEIVQKNRNHLSSQDLKSLEAKIKRFFKMSGTVIRYHRNIGEKALDFALKAGKETLGKAAVKPEDVDLLIYTGVGRGWVEPATANLFQSELGLTSATCFDVLDACASWIRGLAIAKSFLAEKIYKLIMILNCEFNFREYVDLKVNSTRDLENSFSGFTIGEAATATLVTADGFSDESYFSFKTWGEKHGLCKIPLPNAADFSPNSGADRLEPMSFFTIPGELLSFTIRKMVSHFKETQAIASKCHDIVIGHAVSVSSTLKVAQLLKIDPSCVFETHSRFGNTVSASLPLALAVAEAEGKLRRGMRVLLVMGSAGVTSA